MRNLPIHPTKKQKLIIEATRDFWGSSEVSKRMIINCALFLMRRKKGVSLNEEEKDAIWYVSQNLTDENYRTLLLC